MSVRQQPQPQPPEPVPPQGAPPPRRRWSLLRRTLGLLLLVVLLSGAAILAFPDQLLLPWLLPAAQAAARARGYDLSVAHLGGTITDTLVLREVRLTSRDRRGPALDLALPELELRWSPWRALTGAPAPLDAIHVRGGTLHVVVRDGGESDDAWAPGTLASLGRELDDLPALHVEGLRADVVAPSGGLLATPTLAAHATIDLVNRLVTLSDGRLDGDGPDGRLPGGAAFRAPAQLDLATLRDDELRFAFELTALGGALSVSGSARGDVVEAHVTAHAVSMESVWRATQPVAPASPLAGPLLVDGDVRLPLAAGAVSATARFTLGAFRAWGVALDSASGELAWEDGALHAKDVLLAQGGNTFVLESADLPEGGGLLALSAAGHADVADLPSLLAALRSAHLLPPEVESSASFFAERAAALSAIGAPSATAAPPTAGAHGLQLHAALQGGTLRVTDALLSTTGGSLSVSEASLDLSAPRLADAALAVQLDADFTDLAPLGALLGEAPFPGARSSQWAGSFAARVRISGSLAAPVAELDIGARDLLAAGWPLGAVTLQATADEREVQVRALDVQSGAAHVVARGALDLASRSVRGVFAQVQVPDLEAALPGTGLAGVLDGSAELDGPLPLPFGHITLHGSDLRLGHLPADDFDLAATRTPGALRVDRALLRAPWGSLEAAGTVQLREPLPDFGAPAGAPLDAWLDAVTGFVIDRVALSRGELDLTLAEPAVLSHADGLWSGGPVVLLGSAGLLRATFDGAPSASGGATLQHMRLHAEKLQPLLSLPSGSRVDTLDGDLDLAVGPDELFADGTLHALGLSLAADDSGVGASVSGDVTAWLKLSGTLADPRGEVEVSARRLVLAAPGRLAPEGFGPCTLDAHVTLGDVLRIDWLHVDSPHQVNLQAQGTLDQLPDPRAHLAETPVHLALSVKAGQLERLSPLLMDVRRLSGEMAAELQVDGTLGAPSFQGAVEVHDGELRLLGGLPALDALEARLELADHRIDIRALTGELGNAPFTVTGGGTLGADGVALDVALSGAGLLFYRADGVTVRADSDLRVSGPLTALVATGTLQMRDSGVVSSVNLLHVAQGGSSGPARGLRLFSFREPPLSTLAFDVRITASEPFVVRNNIVRGGLRPDLRLTGTGAAPILDGVLAVTASRVVLPAGSVAIDDGRVLFSAADPLVPRLDISATARRRGYDISVLVSGPYDQPVVSLSSVPPLPSDKILLLLLAGQAPGRGAVGPAGSDTTTHVVAVYLGQDLLARWLGDSPLGEEGLLDRLDFDVVKDLSRSNSDLVQVSYRLSALPKQGGTVTFLRAEKDLYNRVNFGVQFLFRLEK